MTALENVAVPLELAGARNAFSRAERELTAVGLKHRLGHYPAELSGGEQQRVALARALAPNPAIVVADEPTGNLDETTGTEIIELLFRGHREHGTTLVLVTHDTALAERCDRVLHMHSGRLERRDRRRRNIMTQTASRVPFALKLAYTAYMAVLIPVYWHYYGPTNFLYFCDVALILTLIAIWPENALLISMCAIGIVVPQALWVADFLGNAAGFSLLGMADYMFDANRSLFLRLLSLFHGWLPFLLIFLVWKNWLRPARGLVVDRARLGAAADLVLLVAAANAKSGIGTGQHQLRLGHERLCRPNLGAAAMFGSRDS